MSESTKALKKLSRQELIELLLEITKENEDLEGRLFNMEEEMKKLEVIYDDDGNIMNSSDHMQEIFARAQSAANQYLDNSPQNKELEAKARMLSEMEKTLEMKAQELNNYEKNASRKVATHQEHMLRLEAETKKRCEDMLRKAKEEADSYVAEFEKHVRSVLMANPQLADALINNAKTIK